MTDNSFSLTDLYPKWVVNSKGERMRFDADKIATVLNRETGLDLHIAEKVAEDVIRKVIGLGMEEISTNYLRELVCVELTQRGLNKFRNLFARAINLENISFNIDDDFLMQFKGKQPDWGPLGYFTYKRTYARIIEKENRKEEFWETVKRVVEGCFSIQKEHCMKLSLPWSDKKAQKSAQRMFEKIWDFKMCPPGRGLWMMGTDFIARHGSMALNNCGFASTADIDLKYSKAFEFVMDALMLGVGVGFDTKGAGKITIKKPKEGRFEFQIPDSREGWVEALKLTLEAFFLGKEIPIYDYSLIRPAGEPIRGFGGIASGPNPLKEMLEDVQKLLRKGIGQKITSVDIVDIMNYIGKCVVAGNVRRSAEIALGDPTDLDFVTCKQDKDALYSHRWASNNSVFAKKGLDYSFIADQIAINGEPGIFWLDNARNYSRIKNKPDFKDKKAAGVNPCITDNTLIAVADGRNAISMKQLAEEGNDIPVYCKDDKGLTVIRMMRNPRITGYNEEIYEVKLDDDSIIKCTGNHKFILRDMSQKEAKELRNGDSLMITPKWQTTWAEIMGEEKKKRSIYWMLNDGKKNTFEHTFIYEQSNKCKIPRGYVLHHKDNDGLNNNIGNLELMLKDAHDSLHDISGDNNPMRQWWQTATELEKRNYRRKMSEALSGSKNPRHSGFTDKEIYNEMFNLISETEIPLSLTRWKNHATEIGMPTISPRWGESQSPIDLIRQANLEFGFDWYDDHVLRIEYNRFIKLLKKTDLELIFENGIIYTYKSCEHCGKQFKVKFARREQAFCSHLCSSQVNLEIAQNAYRDKAKKIRDEKKIRLFDLLLKEIAVNKIIPTKREFIEILNKNDIKDSRTIGMPDSYSQVLDHISEIYGISKINSKKISQNRQYAKEMAELLIENGLTYNHKVISVKRIGFDVVYNGTVDEFHNFGIIINEKTTKSDRPRIEMIFTANCGEQTLESFELCCVTGDTRIQTKRGAPRIVDVVDKEVEVWNGDCWSKVKPFIAAKDKEIFRVYISDGSYLDCTSDHNWHIRPSSARVFRSVETKDLKLGDQIAPFEIDNEFGGIYEPNAFEYGLFSGDGFIDKNYPMVSICGEKLKLKELDVKGTWYKEQIKEGYNEPYNRLNLKDVIDLKLAEHMNDKSRGLPDIIFSWDRESILEFTAGLIETDGNLCHQVNTDNYRIFGNEEKIRDLQILLRRIGINHSTIYSAGDAGEETNYGTRNYTIYCLYIPSYECGEISTRIKKAKRIGPRYAINNRYPEGKKIDRARKQKILKVEKLKELHFVYCFNEPINHMGIFGNVLTYQCLVETFPSRHYRYEEFKETLKYAYLYAKSVTLVNTH
ncbi:MAG: hypothetical protein EU521_00230, partial [Promethearchaeota archaeon]